MTAMACKWNGLFNVGEDFDDEESLRADWDVTAEPVATAAVPVSGASCRLRAPSANSAQTAAHHPPPPGPPLRNLSSHHPLEKGADSTAPCAIEKAVGFRLRCISSSAVSTVSPCSSLPPVATENPSGALGAGLPMSSVPAPPKSDGNQPSDPFPDDFDDWDLDLGDLEDNVPQQGIRPEVPQLAPVQPGVNSVPPAKKMRVSDSVAQVTPGGHLQAPSSANSVGAFHFSRSSNGPSHSSCPRSVSPTVRPQVPALPRGPVTPTAVRPLPRCQTPASASHPAGRSSSAPFSPVSPVPTARTSRSSDAGSPAVTPRSLQTPVFTNHLVQLVSASNKTPQGPRSERARPRTRRFPGPAGVLPQQLGGRSMDDIVVSLPQTPAHGAVARLRSQVPSSQVTEEEEFSGGPWAMMKAEMGLDERNPACFLHSYSVVMVLRKAALKQLAKNKVPNMAVMVKTLLHTHADAKAVFRDPTGEMQGTVHRRLLEDRQGELKTGAVLLLKQVGVFSPSHRNHYLNVTPNNLLRIYPPDATTLSFSQLSHHALEDLGPQCNNNTTAQTSHPPGGPVSQMDLLYDDDEECSESNMAADEPAAPPSSVHKSGSGSTAQGPAGARHVDDSAWETDDLDALLGELPEDSYVM
ncbi:homologous recombination OB-fold protein [Megalops cyprinoides]|uniref:homologous recombination OB-fold protein n=1 Tax=Megalops cyprinoides TaxID=118141 RepID=UPI001864A7DF|nr:homologous recombination OB-fold protein [Megalops cyprinoides]